MPAPERIYRFRHIYHSDLPVELQQIIEFHQQFGGVASWQKLDCKRESPLKCTVRFKRKVQQEDITESSAPFYLKPGEKSA
jgi:hypothetical protein